MNPLDEAKEMNDCDEAAALDAALKQIQEARKQAQIREWTKQYGLPAGLAWEESKAWVDKRARELQERFDAWNRLKLRLYTEIDRRCREWMRTAGFSEEELRPLGHLPQHVSNDDPRFPAFRDALQDYRDHEDAMKIVLKVTPPPNKSDAQPILESPATDETAGTVDDSECRHGHDFRTLLWYGSFYSFTPKQAPVIEKLWEAWKNKTLDVSDQSLLDAVDHAAPPKSLRRLFRGHPAWNALIIQGSRRGIRRLNDPNSKK